MGEVTTLAKNSPEFASLKTTVPMAIVKQWKLSPGSKLDWSWEVVNGELAIVVRKIEHKQKVAEVRPEPQKPKIVYEYKQAPSLLEKLETSEKPIPAYISNIAVSQTKTKKKLNELLDYIMDMGNPRIRKKFEQSISSTELEKIKESRSKGQEAELKPTTLEKLKEIITKEQQKEIKN